MFISNLEKDNIKIDIMGLTARVQRLEAELALLKASKAKAPRPLVKTAEAPWGLKLNGMPRKRPGRAPKFMEVGKP